MNGWLTLKKGLIIIAVIALITATVAIIFWMNKKTEAVLYERLTDKEMAAVVSSLEKLKVDYRLSEKNKSILVDENKIQDVRIKLTSSGFALNNEKGFELFDTVNYGLNEFSQNVLLQRALQGELAKTISAMAGVKSARVHLVLSERGVFKEKEMAKAAVTITLKDGEFLTEQQIFGIQRLIAASINGLEEKNIVISDSRGVVLSHTTEANSTAFNQLVNRKLQIETYLTSKASNLLMDVYGEGNFSVKVDVDLDFSQKHSETEEVLPSSTNKNLGFLVRDKSSVLPRSSEHKDSESDETDKMAIDRTYEYGKRIEKTIFDVGQIKRMTISVIVPLYESDEKINQLKLLIGAALGATAERKDLVEVFALKLTTTNNLKSQSTDTEKHPIIPVQQEEKVTTEPKKTQETTSNFIFIIAAALFFSFIIIFITVIKHRKPKELSSEERMKLLLEVRQWLAD